MDTVPSLIEVMRRYPSGITIATTRTKSNQPYGLTIGSFTSLSLTPTLVLICLDNEASGLEHFVSYGRFGVSVLSEEQHELAAHFATSSSDRTIDVYHAGELNIPLVKDALGWLECQTTETHAGGDHSILIGEVRHARLNSTASRKKPLVYCGGKYTGLK